VKVVGAHSVFDISARLWHSRVNFACLVLHSVYQILRGWSRYSAVYTLQLLMSVSIQ
jgi:hypothetical protein